MCTCKFREIYDKKFNSVKFFSGNVLILNKLLKDE